MSHAYAARGARQTAVLAAIVGLHFAIAVVIALGLEPRPFEVVIDSRPITKPPPPVKPVETLVKPTPGPIDEYFAGEYPEPKVSIPDTWDESITAPDREGVAGEGVSIQSPVEVLPPALRTRPANVAAAINACYPAASRRMNEEGTVVALVTIGAAGSATSWSVAQSSGFARLDAAIACVLRKLDFVAGRRDGQAVSAEARLPIVFRLH